MQRSTQVNDLLPLKCPEPLFTTRNLPRMRSGAALPRSAPRKGPVPDSGAHSPLIFFKPPGIAGFPMVGQMRGRTFDSGE